MRNFHPSREITSLTLSNYLTAKIMFNNYHLKVSPSLTKQTEYLSFVNSFAHNSSRNYENAPFQLRINSKRFHVDYVDHFMAFNHLKLSFL